MAAIQRLASSVVRLAFERPEVLGQGRVGLAHDLEHAAEREVRLGAMRVDLDRRLKPLASRLGIAFLGFDLTQTDHGINIIGVELERAAEAVFRIGQAALEQVDSSQPLLGDGRGRRSSDLVLKRELGGRDIAVIDGRLGVLDDLLRLCGLFRSRCGSVVPSAQPDPTAPGLSREQPEQYRPFGENTAAAWSTCPFPGTLEPANSTCSRTLRHIALAVNGGFGVRSVGKAWIPVWRTMLEMDEHAVQERHADHDATAGAASPCARSAR